MSQVKLSIVIPCYNDMKLGILEKNLENYLKVKDIEIICVDGDSSDGTDKYLQSLKEIKYISSNGTRISLLNKGIEYARGEYVVLHHPRSSISLEDLIGLTQIDNFSWGALTHQFDAKHFLLDFTSWYSNKVRGDRFNIFYLDHCFVIEKNLLKSVTPFPDVEIFEDTEISKLLKSKANSKRLMQKSTTSAIRFLSNGIFKQAALNQLMKLMYYANIDHQTMNKIYEWGLNLNSKSHRPPKTFK